MNPFNGWRITSTYGNRVHPITKIFTKHRGIDLVKSHRAPIPSFTNGKVEYAGGNRVGGFGLYVRIRDDNNHFHYYAHLDEIKCKVGQVIKQGDIVGLQGTTGDSTGSHLHYEIRTKASPGTDVDPTQYLINYYKKEVNKELEQVRKDIAELKRQLAKSPALPWQNTIISDAEKEGVIDKGKHSANEDVQKWFVVELIRKLNKRIDGLEDRLNKLGR